MTISTQVPCASNLILNSCRPHASILASRKYGKGLGGATPCVGHPLLTGGWEASEAGVHAYADFLSAKQQTGWRAYKNKGHTNNEMNEEKNHRDGNPPDHEVLGFASSLQQFCQSPGSPKPNFCRTWSHCSSHCMFCRHIRRAFDLGSNNNHAAEYVLGTRGALRASGLPPSPQRGALFAMAARVTGALGAAMPQSGISVAIGVTAADVSGSGGPAPVARWARQGRERNASHGRVFQRRLP